MLPQLFFHRYFTEFFLKYMKRHLLIICCIVSLMGDYTGWYFKGAAITIALTDKQARTIDYWMVNGQKTGKSRATLTHTLNASTTIRPVFKGSGHSE